VSRRVLGLEELGAHRGAQVPETPEAPMRFKSTGCYWCWSLADATLADLVKAAGARWAVQESFPAAAITSGGVCEIANGSTLLVR